MNRAADALENAVRRSRRHAAWVRLLHTIAPLLHDWVWVAFFGARWQVQACACGAHQMTEAA